MWCAQCFLHVRCQHVGQCNHSGPFILACLAPWHHQCITGPSMHYTAAAPAALLVLLAATAAGWWWWVAGRRAVLAQGRAGLAQGSVQPLPAILCFSLKRQHVLWCAHCVLHLTCTFFFEQDDDIDSVCAMFRANPAC